MTDRSRVLLEQFFRVEDAEPLGGRPGQCVLVAKCDQDEGCLELQWSWDRRDLEATRRELIDMLAEVLAVPPPQEDPKEDHEDLESRVDPSDG